jgi:hypothetical protein
MEVRLGPSTQLLGLERYHHRSLCIQALLFHQEVCEKCYEHSPWQAAWHALKYYTQVCPAEAQALSQCLH